MRDHLGFDDLPTIRRKRPGSIRDPRPVRDDRDTGMMLLSPGTRSAMASFERALRGLCFGTLDQTTYRHAKRQFVRRLRRLEGTLPKDTRGKRRGATGQ